ncbi:hypothetical protein [Mycolicibacterium obuense]|uniref:hypothetical protein n=1 Tax=Mycolicibacterium obuense TaxID=1807 RepID=UPI001F35F576|nr:hypothetical protein [Mycolicibacterium obuense]
MRVQLPACAAAALAVASAVLHGGAALGMGSPWLVALTAAMVAGCLYCGWELMTRDSVRAWLLVALMNLAMIAMHLRLPAGHHSAGQPDGAHGAGGHALHPATVVAAVEVVLAAAVLFARSRTLAPSVACQSGDHDFRADPRAPRGRHAGLDVDRLPGSG